MPVTTASGWLTAVRLARVAQILRLVLPTPPGIRQDSLERLAWRICGGPRDEISALITLLRDLGLVQVQQDTVRRSRAGDKVARTAAVGDLRPLGLALIRAGCFYDQARLLIESGTFDDSGSLVCSLKSARASSPQLLGVLRWWEGVTVLPSVVVPQELITELNTVWALLPPATEVPSWAVERKAVGDRAEMYTVQCERTKVGDPSKIIWVARDSDTMGWDIEDRSKEPRRYIEVKGRRDDDVVFFLSNNEWAKAHELGERYEIHFWGEIDLKREPAVEYAELRAAGYPVIVRNLPARLAEKRCEANPDRWRVAVLTGVEPTAPSER